MVWRITACLADLENIPPIWTCTVGSAQIIRTRRPSAQPHRVPVYPAPLTRPQQVPAPSRPRTASAIWDSLDWTVDHAPYVSLAPTLIHKGRSRVQGAKMRALSTLCRAVAWILISLVSRCPLGSYSAAYGAVDSSTCRPCPANSYTVDSAQTSNLSCYCNLGFEGKGGSRAECASNNLFW
jgi:hypothetical protein